MKRLIIICEGQTEVEFCKDVLFKYFLHRNIILQTPLINKSGGGIVHWNSLKLQIEKHLLETGVFVTTFIDYYGIPDKYEYPSWEDGKEIADKNQRMDFLEQAMKDDIVSRNTHRFVPYIQLHEFEGLLFNNIDVFDENFNEHELNTRNGLIEIIDSFPNPEMINDTPDNAPSKRLQRIVSGYNKIVFGAVIAESIGLENIRRKSPRFNQWINELEQI